ncbi:DUF262 domain-containing protein [Stenotrophomonas pavanii]|uniref:DUF262 domain-containing protein n=1 Tax=Stenotrophomonas pavanii TaxID=487698 RepID=UPI000712D887|nr:DUF262 domain-containing protein [Stenotrophomonas pavanii]KRG79736.1 hypothetical protein ABB31_12550 [Stenotrophomonas pavanii]
MSANNTPQIKGESIQSLYRLYTAEKLLTNRRYQRKLVWSIDEKRAFIDSIQKGFPIPIILLAEVGDPGSPRYEIIDGMQRLNAMMSFIEQEYSINDGYFDLNTIAETKSKLDGGSLAQCGPQLDRAMCVDFAGYQVPVSIYSEREVRRIDEVFRRLNANGKHLSKQELRQAGATGAFANVVRKLSANIRGDSSLGDVLSLNKMKNISLTNKDLPYGIAVDDVFWVKNKILTKEDLRNSKDEEIVADIVAWIISDKAQRSSSEVLDSYYGFGGNVDASQAIDRHINKIGQDRILECVQECFDLVLSVVEKSGENLRDLLFKEPPARFPRYFQLYFIALYEMTFTDQKEVDSYSRLLKSLKHSGENIKLAEGGGNWSAAEKERGIDQISGLISKSFKKTGRIDPSRKYWISRFENILMNSTTEQTLYDFKMGFYDLNSGAVFSSDLFSKCVKTLTAMANTHRGAVGYVIVGVCDKVTSASAHKKFYKSDYTKYGSYYISGIDSEANKYEKDADSYFSKITNILKSQPVSDRDLDYIGRNIFTIRYHDKTVLVMSLSSDSEPSIYGNSYYVRHGSNVEEVKTKDMIEFLKRFG